MSDGTEYAGAAAVRIDDDFVRFGGKSYAIGKITSVEVRKHQPHDARPGGCFAFLACVVLMGGLILHAGSGGTLAFITVALFGVAVIFLGLSTLVEYQLFLITSAAEVQAYVAKDEPEVIELRDKIEAAMVRYSRERRY